jgi:uracil DNA glycosylase
MTTLLCRSERPIVFLLWGKPSQEKGSAINKSLHKVITCSHPSPLGMHACRRYYIKVHISCSVAHSYIHGVAFLLLIASKSSMALQQ